ncbi:tripartite tricarboxylate transporter substrate binding protein [Xenophilus sp. Marseille-Q4582]|uniref:Bug family tripartite tricarboxylate transporter substrate binding protein n=1 Tax=Xenophilus sp. Marseille-Q4582 TaxID=2866600 RepID=UPI001CE48F8B|nr:tripartite tricarboxylate transporter substrate binding protein [Xenophilus sp. Marseille-Q4582]
MSFASRVARLGATCLLAATAAAPAPAADAYPSRPVTMVIPFPPGGGADVLGRVIAQKLGETLGQPMVIDNRAGAGTLIGAAFVAKAPADGYTLLLSSGTTFTVNPAIRSSLPYDPVKSFEPIGVTGRASLVLLAHADVPVKTFGQFVDYVKAAPGKYPYGSFGSGTTSHFAGEAVLAAAGLKMTHVPYKGSAPAMTDLIGGQVPFTFDTVTAAIPQLRSGKIRAIAVTSARRSSLLPEVPTMAESGYPAIDMDTWLALMAPRGLPADVKAKLEQALASVMKDAETRSKLVAQGFEPVHVDAAGAAELIGKELPAMRALAQRAHITAD